MPELASVSNNRPPGKYAETFTGALLEALIAKHVTPFGKVFLNITVNFVLFYVVEPKKQSIVSDRIVFDMRLPVLLGRPNPLVSETQNQKNRR